MKYFLLLFLISSCAISEPDGIRQLESAIQADKQRREIAREPFHGRPLFKKVKAYRQIQDGNVYGEHWIYLNVGREKLNLDEMLGN